MSIRLQKYLAEAGLGSRRRCEELIQAGRVTVDGLLVQIGASVDAETQTVALDGRPVERESKEYWLLNKPAGILSAVSDPRGRRTVTDCIPAEARVFPVGRLDLNSTGLLLITNDGELASRLLHPRYHVEKEYMVTVRGAVPEEALGLLRRGVLLEDGVTAPAEVEVVSSDRSSGSGISTKLVVTIHEGRKRQVRRMFEAVGYRVTALHRSRFDGLTDAGLALGQVRRLSAEELERVRRTAFGD
jgi:23S rRNA pseudouridine2605 synthase